MKESIIKAKEALALDVKDGKSWSELGVNMRRWGERVSMRRGGEKEGKHEERWGEGG